jgi:hypothetical protein
MENFSEIEPKIRKQRGRPRKNKYEKELILLLDENLQKQTKRTLNNRFYSEFALAAFGIFKEKDLKFLTEREKNKTVLTALGRIIKDYYTDDCIELAEYICKEKLNTANALDYIRLFRIENDENLVFDKVRSCYRKVLKTINDSCLTENELEDLFNRLNNQTCLDY